MRGPDDGQLRVALTEDSGIKLAAFRERLRKVLPEEGDPVAGQAAGRGRPVGGGVATASQAGELRLRARRHRHLGHELRLGDTDRGPHRRHRPEDGPATRGEDRRRDESDPLPPRCPVRADARLPHRRTQHRPREGGAERCHRRGRGSCGGHGHRLDPVRQPQLLDRREDRLRLPGPASGAAPADGEAGGCREPCRSSRSTPWST